MISFGNSNICTANIGGPSRAPAPTYLTVKLEFEERIATAGKASLAMTTKKYAIVHFAFWM